MPAYKHCEGCGRTFDQKTWQKESFCGSCGEPLKRGLQHLEPQDLHPYPEPSPSGLRPELNHMISELCEFAKDHPFLFGATAIATGTGAVLLGPGLMTLGQGIMIIGGILMGAGMLSVVYVEKGDAEKLIAAGLLTLIAGSAVALVGYLLTAGGFIAVVGGTGVAVKATAEALLRRRIEKQLREKSMTELIGISRRLTG